MKDSQAIPTKAQDVQHWKMISLPMTTIGLETRPIKMSATVHFSGGG